MPSSEFFPLSIFLIIMIYLFFHKVLESISPNYKQDFFSIILHLHINLEKIGIIKALILPTQEIYLCVYFGLLRTPFNF